ncbi:MAG: hypothetical protein IT246_02690 [Bacteroidia bacterium]|nr:hypothetical protein [Bacteroidia bacterium]
MSNAIQAVSALINSFASNEVLAQSISSVFVSKEDFMTKVKTFDETFSAHPSHEAIQEFAFDLLMTHHLSNIDNEEDYFETDEWLKIEDKTIDRGTELLNILLYISEAKDSDAPITIEDFLYEFLLVDEDEFQDEHRIYESFIANQELVDEDVESILEVAESIPENEEIKELFIPLFLYFQTPASKVVANDIAPKLTNMDKALLQMLFTFSNG